MTLAQYARPNQYPTTTLTYLDPQPFRGPGNASPPPASIPRGSFYLRRALLRDHRIDPFNFVPQAQHLLRIVVYIRSQPSSIRARCDSIQYCDIFRAAYVIDTNAGVPPLSKSTATLAAVQSLVQTASQVQSQATLVLRDKS